MNDNKWSSRNGSIVRIDTYKDTDPFQQILAKAGNNGRFQLIHNTIFVMSLSIMGSMIYMNIILALSVPEHWCTVQGRQNTNFTLNEWQELTLPK